MHHDKQHEVSELPESREFLNVNVRLLTYAELFKKRTMSLFAGWSDCTLGWNITGIPLDRDQYMAHHQMKEVQHLKQMG